MNIAFSGESLILLRITYTNWPTVKSDGTRYFFLSMVAMSLFSTFSQMTWWCNALSVFYIQIKDVAAASGEAAEEDDEAEETPADVVKAKKPIVCVRIDLESSK